MEMANVLWFPNMKLHAKPMEIKAGMIHFWALPLINKGGFPRVKFSRAK